MNAAVFLAIMAGFCEAVAEGVPVPVVADSNLELTLLASEPEIVTPVGLAADREGRLYVVESHTHSRGSAYKGPPSDRVRVYEDTNGDGRLDRSRIYADGLRNALAIAFSANGDLYVVQMKSVLVLRDSDRDGTCDSRETVLTVETQNNNHHGVLLAVALDNQHRLYVSLGNIGGHAYTIEGTDGSRVAGQGDSGLIVRCRADGTSLERFAHGFWNPCDLKFDTAGRLLATDNDPDARGPNRVLHVIAGGDYGYRSRFGPSGLHPYCAWNGELPGTLPMLAGVGEAPVGLLDCKISSLPVEYQDDLLVSVWGTNQVVRIRTKQRGVSVAGEVAPLLAGDRNFRPTGMTATADGTVFIADWADRRYPVHGQGRIWRLAARSGVATLNPQPPFSEAERDPGQSHLQRLDHAKRPESFDLLLKAAATRDPFVSQTALRTLARPVFRDSVTQLLEDNRASHRLLALLALLKGDVQLSASRLRRLLNDADPRIRKLTMIRLGETMRLELAADLKQSLPLQTDSADLFETFLATSQLLSESEVQHVRTQTPGSRIDRSIDQELIHNVLANKAVPLDARAMAIRYLTDFDRLETVRHLSEFAVSEHSGVAHEAIRALADSRDTSSANLLITVSRSTDFTAARRCEAIMSLAKSAAARPATMLSLLTDPDPRVALTAARGLTVHAQEASVRKTFQDVLASSTRDAATDPLIRQLRFALKQTQNTRPQTDDQWRRAVANGGDAVAGRRVFFDARATCSKCHRVHGRGGRIGPDLSNIAAAKTRDELLASLLHPSRDKSPDYQGYVVLMQDGRVLKGTQFHFRGESAEMLLEDGRQIRFRLSDTEGYRPMDTSLMPENVIESISVDEVRDLLAFLEILRDVPQRPENVQ